MSVFAELYTVHKDIALGAKDKKKNGIWTSAFEQPCVIIFQECQLRQLQPFALCCLVVYWKGFQNSNFALPMEVSSNIWLIHHGDKKKTTKKRAFLDMVLLWNTCSGSHILSRPHQRIFKLSIIALCKK